MIGPASPQKAVWSIFDTIRVLTGGKLLDGLALLAISLGVNISVISKHISNIIKTDELGEKSNVQKMHIRYPSKYPA